MMELKLIDQHGQSTAKVAAADAVFGRGYNEALIHQVVTSYLANARSGTRMQKDRGEVKHSTKKPFAPERHRPRARRHDLESAVARRRPDFPESAG